MAKAKSRFVCQECGHEALRWAEDARASGEPLSVGVSVNAVELLEALLAADRPPDVATDLTAAHDLRYGYVPVGTSTAEAAELRRRVTSPKGTTERAVAVLQGAHLDALFAEATDAALARARELAAGA